MFNNIDNSCPCLGCTAETGRRVGCHSSCDKYIRWARKNQKEKKEVEKKRIVVHMSDMDKMYRLKKIQHKQWK